MTRACGSRTRTSKLLLLTLLSAGCGSLPPTHYYSLSTPADYSTSPAMARQCDLAVDRFDVAAPYDQSQLVFRQAEAPHELGFYHYHRWGRPLSDELAEALVHLLRSRLSEARVELLGADASCALVLRGQLLHLEEVSTSEGLEARLEVRFLLEDASGTTVWGETVSERAGGLAPEVEDLVGLMRTALDNAAGHLVDPLRAALADTPPAR